MPFARDIIEKDFSLTGDVTAFEAAKIMKERRKGFVAVAACDGMPIGMVTEWGYILKIAAEEKDPTSVPPKGTKSVNLVTVPVNWGIAEVAQFMAQKRIRRVFDLNDSDVMDVINARTTLAKMKDYVDTVSTETAMLQGPWR